MRWIIDGQPYMPFLTLDPQNEDSIRHVVATMFRLKGDTYSTLKVLPVPAGNTNILFCVSGLREKKTSPRTTTNNDDDDDENVPDSVLVRVFGAQGLIDRDVETSTYAALAQQGIALPHYGRFANGRLEEWLGNMKTLSEPDTAIPEISQTIAKHLAILHSKFKIPEHLQDYHDPTKPPTLWTQLYTWLDQSLASTFLNDHDTQRAQALELSNLKDELEWLRSSVVSNTAKVGFCHNDVLAANILWSSSRLQLIDFEYGGINYLSYDIANHFNEFAGGTSGDATPDYTQFPSPELQRAFVTEYLNNTSVVGGNGNSHDQAVVEDTLREVKGFVLANHLVWGLWGVNQAATEGCDEFDYLQYATCRIRRYYIDKKEWETTTA